MNYSKASFNLPIYKQELNVISLIGGTDCKMKQMIVLLVFITLLISSLAQSTCTKQLIEVGIGYNLISGNPQTSPDPGLKRSNQILRYGKVQEYETVDEQTTYCVPKEISITPQSFCSYAEETKFFAGTESYRKELEADVKLSGNGGQLFKFS